MKIVPILFAAAIAGGLFFIPRALDAGEALLTAVGIVSLLKGKAIRGE